MRIVSAPAALARVMASRSEISSSPASTTSVVVVTTIGPPPSGWAAPAGGTTTRTNALRTTDRTAGRTKVTGQCGVSARPPPALVSADTVVGCLAGAGEVADGDGARVV